MKRVAWWKSAAGAKVRLWADGLYPNATVAVVTDAGALLRDASTRPLSRLVSLAVNGGLPLWALADALEEADQAYYGEAAAVLRADGLVMADCRG